MKFAETVLVQKNYNQFFFFCEITDKKIFCHDVENAMKTPYYRLV